MTPPLNPGQLLGICAQPRKERRQSVQDRAKLAMIPMGAGQHQVRLESMACLLTHGFKQQGTTGDHLGMALRDGKPGKP